MTHPKHVHSTGKLSRYVVTDMATGKLVTDVIILFPVEHHDLIPTIRQLGYDKLADDIEESRI